ncbi:MAG: hypothetical protein M0T72_06035 [Candidatus Dormibacteraeota bacterium]|nr:hypothetical protein [Candidatus Dormibacteraeota bacterium]
MGLSKVVPLANGRGVKLVHQLNSDGTPYAEDITIEVQPGVDPERLSYLLSKAGTVGAAGWSFAPMDGVHGLLFPEDS